MHPYRGWPFLSDPSHPILSVIWAVLIHGVLSLLVVLPIVVRSRRPLLGASLAFIAGPALDLDHVAVAGSLDPDKLEHLVGGRPATHSLGFGVIVALVALVATQRKLIAWSVFAVVAAHLLFDAAGGGESWLYPLRSPDAIPWLLCPVGIVVLTAISELTARRAYAVRAAGPTTGLASAARPSASGSSP